MTFLGIYKTNCYLFDQISQLSFLVIYKKVTFIQNSYSYFSSQISIYHLHLYTYFIDVTDLPRPLPQNQVPGQHAPLSTALRAVETKNKRKD